MTPRVYTVVPAAGLSRRMGRPKLPLPLAGRPVLQHVLTALTETPVDGVVVVVGPSTAFLAEFVSPPTLFHILEEDTPDMQATVCGGVDYWRHAATPTATDALLLALGDHPTLSPRVVRLMVDEYARHGDRAVVPTNEGRRGHPLLLPWSWTVEICGRMVDGGVGAILRRRAAEVVELPVAAPEVLGDMDTPDDYALLQARFKERGFAEGDS
ncbi:MAG: nucleotidyltransferase family protein [Planctomycetia bacterium]